MKLLAILTFVVIAVATIVANSGAGARLFGFVEYIPGQDVTAHFLLYAALGLTASAGLRRSVRPALYANWAWFVVAIGVLVVAEEISQAFIPTRSFSGADMIASLGGLVVGARASSCFARSRVDQTAA